MTHDRAGADPTSERMPIPRRATPTPRVCCGVGSQQTRRCFQHRPVESGVMDAWTATAGLRGGHTLEARFSTFAASYNLLSFASADPPGLELLMDWAALS